MLEAVQFIVEQGVDVNAANTDGRTALDTAKSLKYESVVRYLQQKGAKGKSSQQQ
jgi:ankyrin repeat protein